jgi:purine-binding chemotaxis protein CheW
MTDSLRPADETDKGANVGAGGKYLTFGLAEEVYGLEILRVREIIGLTHITRVPKAPPFVRGVVNLRGRVVPVIDLNLQFGMTAVVESRETCIIIVEINRKDSPLTTGILVDRVSEVVDLGEDQIDPPPSFGTTVSTEFIRGMGKMGNDLVILLDINKVLSVLELSVVEDATRKKGAEPETRKEETAATKETYPCSEE